MNSLLKLSFRVFRVAMSTMALLVLASTACPAHAQTIYYGITDQFNSAANVVALNGVNPSGFTLTTGAILYVIPSVANSGVANVYLTIGSSTAIVQIKKNTASGLASLSGGELQAGTPYQLIYDGTYFDMNTAPQSGRTVNLRDFGGVCDGATSTNAAFTAAVAALGVTGGTIELPTGQCIVTSKTIVNSGASWSINSNVISVASTSNIVVGSTASDTMDTNSGIQPNSVVTAINQTTDKVTISKYTTAASPSSPNLTFVSGLIFNGRTITIAGQGFDNGATQYGTTLVCATGIANCITFNGSLGGGMRDLAVTAVQSNNLAISNIAKDSATNLLQVTVTPPVTLNFSSGWMAGNTLSVGTASGVTAGMQVGQSPAGTYIPANTTVNWVGTSLIGAAPSTASKYLQVPTAGIFVGESVSGTGIGSGVTVAAILSPTLLQLSAAPTTATTATYTFGGGPGIATLSNTIATASGSQNVDFVYWSPSLGDVVNITGFSTAPGTAISESYANGAWSVGTVADILHFDLANQSNNGPASIYSFNTTCALTNSSVNVFTCGPATNLAPGQVVTGSGIPTGASPVVLSTVNGSAPTLSQAATMTTASSLTVTNTYGYNISCTASPPSTTLTTCGPATYLSYLSAGNAITDGGGGFIPPGSTIASISGASITISKATTGTMGGMAPATVAVGGVGAVTGYQMEPGSYEMVLMGGAARMSFERVAFSQGMNAVNFLRSSGSSFLFATFIGFYDQQVLLFNGGSDVEESQGFDCYQCTVSSGNATTDNVVFDGDTASHFIRDSYIAQGARRGIWLTNRYGGTCPGAIQVSGSAIGEATVGSSIQLDCGNYFMMHDVIDLATQGGGFNGLDGFDIDEGPQWKGPLILTNNNIAGAPRDGIRVAAGYAQINNNYIANNGGFIDIHKTLQVTGVTGNGDNPPMMRVTYAPGPWAPNPRDWVSITGALGAAGNWEVAPVPGSNAFDLIGSLYYFTATGSVSGTTVTLTLPVTPQMVVGQRIKDTKGCLSTSPATFVTVLSGSTVTVSPGASGSCSGDTFTFINDYTSTGATTLASASLLGDGIRILPGATNIQANTNHIGSNFPPQVDDEIYGIRNDGDLASTYGPESITALAKSSNCAVSGICPIRVTTTTTHNWIPLPGDLVTISGASPSTLNGTWPVNQITPGASIQYDLVGSIYSTGSSASGTIAPSSQNILSVLDNDLNGNTTGGYYSGKYASTVLFKNNNGVEQADVSFAGSTPGAIANGTLYPFFGPMFVSGKKVLVTRVTASLSSGMGCNLYLAVNGAAATSPVSLTPGASTSNLIGSPVLVDGTSSPALVQYEFLGCGSATGANVQFEGINID